jgi:hypothetical protein
MRIVLDVSLSERLPERVEEAAYYVVCEALTNVIKYGTGGAESTRGSGLRGLRPRAVGAATTQREWSGTPCSLRRSCSIDQVEAAHQSL